MDRPPPPHGNHPSQFGPGPYHGGPPLHPFSAGYGPPPPQRPDRTGLVVTVIATVGAVVIAVVVIIGLRVFSRAVVSTVTDADSVASAFEVGDCVRAEDSLRVEKIDCDDAAPGEDYWITEEVRDGQECADTGLETLTAGTPERIFCLQLV